MASTCIVCRSNKKRCDASCPYVGIICGENEMWKYKLIQAVYPAQNLKSYLLKPEGIERYRALEDVVNNGLQQLSPPTHDGTREYIEQLRGGQQHEILDLLADVADDVAEGKMHLIEDTPDVAIAEDVAAAPDEAGAALEGNGVVLLKKKLFNDCNEKLKTLPKEATDKRSLIMNIQASTLEKWANVMVEVSKKAKEVQGHAKQIEGKGEEVEEGSQIEKGKQTEGRGEKVEEGSQIEEGKKIEGRGEKVVEGSQIKEDKQVLQSADLKVYCCRTRKAV